MRTRSGILLALCAVAMAGCGDRLSLGGGGGQPAPGGVETGPRQGPVLVSNMAGRWRLSSGAVGCGVNFGGAAGAPEGTIAPEGGCPGNFFTSRKWAFEENGLAIRDHRGEPLASLTMRSPNQFDGRSTAGEPITLTR